MAERRDGHDCWNCEGSFALVYEAQQGEATEAAPVNCPRCGKLNHLPVARSAAVTHSYRSEEIHP